jgi:hypothetical protein
MKTLWPGLLVCALTTCAASTHAALTISTQATQNVRCADDTCAATAAKAVLNVSDLRNLLAFGNVVVTTGSGTIEQEPQDIVVAAGFNWVNSSSLTLDASRSVVVEQAIESGAGAVSLITDDGRRGGTLSFGAAGRLYFFSTESSLTINGAPYTLVNSIASLASAIAANPGGAYALSNNYDALADGTYKSSPIATTLTGTFEGLGNTISNLRIKLVSSHGAAAGLLDAIGPSGTVNDVRLIKEHMVAQKRGSVDGLVVNNYGSMSGDEVQGSFTGNCRCSFAGLAALNEGTITSSSADVRMSSLATSAGLVNKNLGTVSGSQASGSIAALGSGPSLEVGGLVAFNKGMVSRSSANVVATGGSQAAVGGLIGVDEGTTTISYATGAVTGGDSSMIGGLIGNDHGDTENSYATGAVTGTTNAQVGGLTGGADAGIQTSYSTGVVSGGTGSVIGGFIGGFNDQSKVSDCYWDTTTSMTDEGTGNGGNVTGLTGLTTQQLQSGLPSGFSGIVWAEDPDINGGLPYLTANPPPN